MKKLILMTILVALMAAPAFANPTVTISDSPVGTVAGIYLVSPNADLIAISAETGDFMSFCLEAFESIDATGATIYDAAILTEALMGDGNADAAGPLGGDLLSAESAYLYTQFRNGSLVIDTNAKANALQFAFWHLEDEDGYDVYAGLTPATQAYVTLAQGSGWNDIGNVRVLNLTLNDGKVVAQDMMIMVPAPGAMILGGIGVSFVGWLRRRRSL